MKITSNRASGVVCLACVVLAFGVAAVRGQQGQGQGQGQRGAREPIAGRGAGPQNAASPDVHVLPVQGGVYMLVGGGGNVTVQIGKDGVLLVDTSTAQMSDKVLAEIRKLSDKPIRYIINTHVHPDHVGGNESIGKSGATIAGGNVGADVPSGATIVAHENVLNRMSAPTGTQAPFPLAAWPTDTYFTKQKEVYFNDEAVVVMHQPAAHTDGDSIVYFRRSDVISTGDVFITTSFPVIDRQRGGSLNGIIKSLNVLLDLAIPREKQEGGTYLIPGHGRLTDEADLLEYRDMVTIIRDRVEDLVKKGMTLEQVKAAKPTLDYDGRYGTTTGAWTTEMFVEAVYAEMKGASGKK
jgi:glyoxylase-like metal-dependent hydrolase (beta-lactamase superfamily II)